MLLQLATPRLLFLASIPERCDVQTFRALISVTGFFLEIIADCYYDFDEGNRNVHFVSCDCIFI